MSCIFIMKQEIENPEEWYDREIGGNEDWEYNKILQAYHKGSVYLKEGEGYTAFHDHAEYLFAYWETSVWIALAAGKELIYGYYSEDLLEAEFIHIKNGKCIREYREYDDDEEEKKDYGDQPKFKDWVDVASYVDQYMT